MAATIPGDSKAEEIPLHARIFAIGDVYDALTSDRPYRRAWNRERALQYIRSEAGRLFDPGICETFLAMSETSANQTVSNLRGANTAYNCLA